jgi:hypothetical protein
MRKTNIALFVLYVVIMLGALINYGIWMGSNNIRDEIFELVCFLFIGFLFLFSVCQFVVMDSITYTGLIVFLSFVGVATLTLTKPNTMNGVSNRNLMIGLGISSLIPLLSIPIGEYLSSDPIRVPVNLD